MKILMATMGLDIGGAETHIVELSKHLKQQGHEVVIVSNGGVYVPEITAAGIRHYQAPLNRRSVREMGRGRRILEQVIREEKPDVVHAHARIPAFLCGSLQKKLDFPFVTSCHGVYQVSGALKLLSNWGQRTLAVSEDIRDYLMEQYNVPREQIALTINGIDTEKFSPATSGERVRREFGLGESPVICHVSRLDQATALTARQLISLAPALSEAYPGLRLLIVGGGEVYEELLAQARDVNEKIGRDCVILTGPRTDINELVSVCQVFVGVSRAALEAMAACKSVVLSGAQGHTGLFVPELLDKAVDTNFCCRTDPIAQPEGLLADIRRAMALSPAEKERLGDYGRQVIQERYSVRRMAEDCLAMYDQVRKRKYHVVMSGYYGFSNTGDDAILESIRQGIRAVSDEVELTVLSNDPEQTRTQFGLNALSRLNAFQILSAMRQGDVLLSGGGSLLQDTTSTRSLVYYLSIMSLARMMGKPVMLYANGIGPVRRERNRAMVRRAVEKASAVTLRDSSSAQELREMGVKRPDLIVTADPVFLMEAADAKRGKNLLDQTGVPQGAPFVAVSVRDWPAALRFPEQLAQVCDHLRQAHGLEVLFLLMQPKVDAAATQRVRKAMREPSYLLEAGCTPREMMAVLGQARLCLAMRLHTLIFAGRMAVPTLGLVYDPKVASFLEELELPCAGHVECFDEKAAMGAVDALLGDYDDVLRRLKEKAARMCAAAGENEKKLLELLESAKG